MKNDMAWYKGECMKNGWRHDHAWPYYECIMVAEEYKRRADRIIKYQRDNHLSELELNDLRAEWVLLDYQRKGFMKWALTYTRWLYDMEDGVEFDARVRMDKEMERKVWGHVKMPQGMGGRI